MDLARHLAFVPVAIAAIASATALSVHAQAPSDTRAQCILNHGRGQELRADGKLVEAREALQSCAQRTCPPAVTQDCMRWLDEVRQQIPSVVFVVQSDRGDESSVRVLVNGQLLTDKIDGRAVDMNPGSYQMRFELAGSPAVVQQVVLREGEHSRTITVDFRTSAPSAKPTIPIPATTSHGTVVSTRPVPAAVYVFGVSGAAAVLTSIGFALWGWSDRSSAMDSCAPLCESSAVNRVHTKLLVADVAGGVGLLSLGLAGYLYWSRPTVQRETPSPVIGTIAPLQHGLMLGLQGTY